MDPNPAELFPETVTDSDLRAFHRLVLLAAHADAIEILLAALADHLGVPSLSIASPDDPPPEPDTVLRIPLHYRERWLGDLCAPISDNQPRDDLADRLQFFSSAVALHLVMSTRLADQPGSTAVDDATRELREERDRLEAILEATNDAILLVDTHDLLVMATPQFESFTGISRYEILGLSVEQLAQRIDDHAGLPRALANVLRALSGNFTESLGGEFELVEPQPRVLVWYSLPVYVRSGVLLGRIFAFRDATRERELDRMKTDFISLVSHELRTPLTSVKGFSDLILESNLDRLDPDSREYLSIISFNADRLITLINDILDITRIDTDRIELKPEPCPAADIVDQAARALNSQLVQRGHRLSVDIPPDLPLVWADRARLVQIVTNLLSNAIKYTLKPGEIVVSARAVETPDDLPERAPRAQICPCVVISVRDTGIGIAPSHSHRLFQRFYRIETESSRGIGGTGLGLAIVKSLVELQGGRVWFESEPNLGSTFSFSIPIARNAPLAPY